MSNFQGTLFSKGLYSSWCHMPFQNLLFDAGEGAATSIGNGLTNITRIFIGHDHGDHTLGLPSIVGCRNAARGTSRNIETRDHNKPLDIYFPADNLLMDDLVCFIRARTAGWLRYELNFHRIDAGMDIEIGPNLFVHTFSMSHQKRQSTLGYSVVEGRKKLSPKYSGQDIAALKRSGLTDVDLMVPYRKNMFAYCLDSSGFNPTEIDGCDQVVMDSTFLDPKDRDDPTHFTLDEAKNVAIEAGVKKMYAAHISPRYSTIPDDGTFSGTKVCMVDPNFHYPIS